jgi:hypothetical protein
MWVGLEMPAGSAKDNQGDEVAIDGLTARVPATWKKQQPTVGSRLHQFILPKVMDDKDDAELIVSHFGKGQGGGAEANVNRWKDMFLPPENKKIDDVASTKKMKVGPVDVTYFDVTGTYKYKASPMATKVDLRPNYRMVSVIFESKNGPYFIRLLGPAKTVAHHKKGFDDWLNALK